MDKFWMVLVDGTDSTSYKHPTLDSARKEAERLLRMNCKDDGVTILEAIEYGKIVYPPVDWKPVLDGAYKGEEVPF